MRSLIPLRSRARPRPCTIAGASPLRAIPSSSCTASYLTSSQLPSCLRAIISCRSPRPAGRVPQFSVRSELVVLITSNIPSKSFFFYLFFISYFRLDSSTDGPLNAVIYILYVIYTLLHHIILPLKLYTLGTPDFLPLHCRFNLLRRRLASPCPVSFPSPRIALPRVLPFPYCMSECYYLSVTHVTLENCAFAFPTTPDRIISDSLDTHLPPLSFLFCQYQYRYLQYQYLVY